MKYVVIFALLFVTGVFLFFYLFTQRDLLDWDKYNEYLQQKSVTTQVEAEKSFQLQFRRGMLLDYVDHDSVRIMLIATFLSVFGLIGFVHSIVDKLFYKKFYESPDLITAGRRAFLWAGIFTGLLFLGIVNIIELRLLLLIIAIGVGVEIIITSFLPKTHTDAAEQKTND